MLNEAIAHYQEAARLDAKLVDRLALDLAEALRVKAQAFATRGQWDQAIEAVTTALVYEPDQPSNYLLRATYRAGAGRAVEACRDSFVSGREEATVVADTNIRSPHANRFADENLGRDMRPRRDRTVLRNPDPDLPGRKVGTAVQKKTGLQRLEENAPRTPMRTTPAGSGPANNRSPRRLASPRTAPAATR
jgi:tetratricopeptide (TPR) repeat protein